MHYTKKNLGINSTYNPDDAMQNAISNTIVKYKGYGDSSDTGGDDSGWIDLAQTEIGKWSDVLRAKLLYKNYPYSQAQPTASASISSNLPMLAFIALAGIIIFKMVKG